MVVLSMRLKSLIGCDTLLLELWSILDSREELRWAHLSCYWVYLFSFNSLVNDLSSLRSDGHHHETVKTSRHGIIDEPDDHNHGDYGPSGFTMMTPRHTRHVFGSGLHLIMEIDRHIVLEHQMKLKHHMELNLHMDQDYVTQTSQQFLTGRS
ncbi:hypothetical protein ACH5RR_032285 [Cinchona calisaya]|uniref:Uncharacterized protein n=1 Tax=Cinchona calisaya TaxID=153742 RepID=A0ABD2YIR6_9GENT